MLLLLSLEAATRKRTKQKLVLKIPLQHKKTNRSEFSKKGRGTAGAGSSERYQRYLKVGYVKYCVPPTLLGQRY